MNEERHRLFKQCFDPGQVWFIITYDYIAFIIHSYIDLVGYLNSSRILMNNFKMTNVGGYYYNLDLIACEHNTWLKLLPCVCVFI